MGYHAGRFAVILLGLFIVACTKVGHIQQTEPVRSLSFSGSHKALAQCIQRRLGSKVKQDSFGDQFVLYDSAKNRGGDGLTHYSITVTPVGVDGGLAQWRIVGSATAAGTTATVSDAIVRDFWQPVEECAARVKQATSP